LAIDKLLAILCSSETPRRQHEVLAKVQRDVERCEPRRQLVLRVDLFAHEQAASCRPPIQFGKERGFVPEPALLGLDN
jgi:hypothetical protein